jgi:hypothetical protein
MPAALSLLLASPLAAYTIYLKNGQTIQAKGKYRVENGKAYITLYNGTQSFINASEIDVARTETANKSDYGGNAVILDPGTKPPADAPAPVQPQKRLSDMIASKQASRDLPGPGRAAAAVPDAARSVGKTRAGYPDFATMARQPFAQTDVLAELQQFFHSQGIDDVEIYTGTSKDRPLVELTTASEGAVFRSLGIAANALLHVRDRFPNRIPAFELLMMTPQRERAGQFVLTPDMASDLVSRKVDAAAFYVHNVQF